jgi:hypothetical protein
MNTKLLMMLIWFFLVNSDQDKFFEKIMVAGI